MSIRRFKSTKHPWEIDYIQFDEDTGVDHSKRIDHKGSVLDDTGMPLDSIKRYDLIELPCYAKDLIEGDIAVIEVGTSNYTWYVFESQEGVAKHLAAVSLSHQGKYWDMQNGTARKIRVVALLGNSFDNERVTYGVKRYG